MLDSQNLRVIAPNQTWDSNYIKVKQALIVLNKELEDKKVLKDEGEDRQSKIMTHCHYHHTFNVIYMV